MRGTTFFVAAALFAAAGCGTDDSASGASAASTIASVPDRPASHHERAGILAAAAAYRVYDDNSFGGSVNFPLVNVVDSYGLPSSVGYLRADPDHPLDDVERTAIEDALAPLAVEWVPDMQAVIGTGEMPEFGQVGVILTLGEPVLDGSVAEVASTLWCGGDCGIGGTHLLERSGGDSWTVTGVTDDEGWIS